MRGFIRIGKAPQLSTCITGDTGRVLPQCETFHVSEDITILTYLTIRQRVSASLWPLV